MRPPDQSTIRELAIIGGGTLVVVTWLLLVAKRVSTPMVMTSLEFSILVALGITAVIAGLASLGR